MVLADEKYVRTTTFRRSGAGVSTATWVVPLDGDRVGFWTSSATGKVKRLRQNPRVTLQPGDSRGRAKEGTEEVSGTAELVTSGPDFDAVQSRVRAKYGFTTKVTKLLNQVGHLGRGPFPYADTVVVVTLEPENRPPVGS